MWQHSTPWPICLEQRPWQLRKSLCEDRAELTIRTSVRFTRFNSFRPRESRSTRYPNRFRLSCQKLKPPNGNVRLEITFFFLFRSTQRQVRRLVFFYGGNILNKFAFIIRKFSIKKVFFANASLKILNRVRKLKVKKKK